MLPMRSLLILPALLLAFSVAARAADDKDKPGHFLEEEKSSEGSVTVGGKRIDYQAVAGTLVVHGKGWEEGEDKDGAEAAMFYAAYFKKGESAEARPLTFLFNGGPGSATIWLHMGAFGPRRLVTAEDRHLPAAPYRLINNDDSLLDASDLVFIDAPGTGFSRIRGKDKEKAFYGVDGDAQAFADFIAGFLSKYGRWNSPRFVFGESYGTLRAALLANLLQTRTGIDLNGLVLVSQVFNYDVLPDYPDLNPGIDQPYILLLPSYAATAWYHHRLAARYGDLAALVAEAESFATNDYAGALMAGASLAPERRAAVIARLQELTGLPADYLDKANLRVTPGAFAKALQADRDMTVGSLDSRFSGPTLDPLAKEAGYDPQSAAVSSGYVSVFNDYVRKTLHYGDGKTYHSDVDIETSWDFSHQPPGASRPLAQQVNVMPDLANAMKRNPGLKILVNSGYFDLVTPFFEGIYEMRQLQIPPALQANIDFRFYPSGHMIYGNAASLKALHDNIAAFIRANGGNVP